MNESVEASAEALFAARRDSRQIETVPGAWIPQSLDAAYVVQDAVMRREGAIGGWKVLAGDDPAPICSPIPASRFYQSGVRLDRSRLLIHLTEVEVAVRLATALPVRNAPYSSDEAVAAIGSVHAALEMCASSFAPAMNAPHLLKMADLQSNAAVIVGEGVPLAADTDFAALSAELSYDGKVVERTDTGASWAQIAAAVAYIANMASARGHGLKAGDVLITGARLKHPAVASHQIVGTVAGLPEVVLDLE